MISRRLFVGAALAAPALVRPGLLMPLSVRCAALLGLAIVMRDASGKVVARRAVRPRIDRTTGALVVPDRFDFNVLAGGLHQFQIERDGWPICDVELNHHPLMQPGDTLVLRSLRLDHLI